MHLLCVSSTLVHHTVAALEEEKKAAMIEREALIANYEKHLQIEKEQKESRRKVHVCTVPIIVVLGVHHYNTERAVCSFSIQSNAQYQASLRDQILYQKQQAQEAALQLSRELAMAAKEESLYQDRLRAALAEPLLDKTHPRRLKTIKK